MIDCVESKVFGIGLEAYTVGSSEFYMAYAAQHPGVYNLLDNGHYHPTEMVSDKISSLLAFFDKLPLHVTRPVRWDSDHVVRLDDELREIAMEIVRNDALDQRADRFGLFRCVHQPRGGVGHRHPQYAEGAARRPADAA